MLLQELVISGNASVPQQIKGRPLSDFSIVVGSFQGEYSVVARSKNTKFELAVFDNRDDAIIYKNRLIKAGAKEPEGWS